MAGRLFSSVCPAARCYAEARVQQVGESPARSSEKASRWVHRERMERFATEVSGVSSRSVCSVEGRRAQRTGERLMMVRPCSSTSLLTGRTLLNSEVGRWLLRLRWPYAAVAFLGRVLMVVVFSNYFNDEVIYEGSGGQGVRVSVRTPAGCTIEIICALCVFADLVILMHGVNVQLVRLTLKSFDPWLIMICKLRAGISYFYSRGKLTGVVMAADDVALVVIVIEWALKALMIEAADLRRVDKSILLSASLLMCIVVWSQVALQRDSINWDPEATVDIWWLAPMTLKSQFVSAMSTVIIYLSKAFMNFAVLGRSFMFLRSQFVLEVERPDLVFEKLDLDGDGEISYNDWQASLSILGIPQSKLLAGFNVLDVGASSSISFEAFESFFRERCRQHPGMNHMQHLKMFCHEAWATASHAVPLRRMVGSVLAQWHRVELHSFSTVFYNRLLDNDHINDLFQGKSLAAQAAMFSAFVAMALQWLAAGDLQTLVCRVRQLGERHAKYGLQLSMLSTFQASLFSTLESQLGSAFLQLQHEWGFVWMHFFTSPFIRGLAQGQRLNRKELLCYAQAQVLDDIGEVVDVLMEELMQRSPGVKGMFTEITLATHKVTIASFLTQIVRDLVQGRVMHARSKVRALASVHWNKNVSALHLAHFQEEFLRALRSVKKEQCSQQLLDAWTFILQLEVIDAFLTAPFAEVDDALKSLPFPDDAAILDEEQWLAMLGKLNIPRELLRDCFVKLRLHSPTTLTFEFVRVRIMSECMMWPGRDCSEVVEDWCRKVVQQPGSEAPAACA